MDIIKQEINYKKPFFENNLTKVKREEDFDNLGDKGLYTYSIIKFGKYKGKLIKDLLYGSDEEKQYLKWFVSIWETGVSSELENALNWEHIKLDELLCMDYVFKVGKYKGRSIDWMITGRNKRQQKLYVEWFINNYSGRVSDQLQEWMYSWARAKERAEQIKATFRK